MPRQDDKASVTEDIRRIIAAAIEGDGCIDAAKTASIIAQAHPKSGLTAAQIADRVIEAAVAAHIALELRKPSFAHS